MITKFNIFESNDNDKKLFYHATKFENLPYILEEGLTPNIDRDVNWSGLSDWSRGKVFVTDSFTKALDYGQLINESNYFPVLKIWIDPKTLTKDKYSDFYSTEPIIGYFEVKTSNTENEWENLKDFVNDLEEIEESIIFESNNDYPYYYHATKCEYLPSIVEHGLVPDKKETNWTSFKYWCKGKVFFTSELTDAIWYGQSINSINKDIFYPILRIKINPNQLKGDGFGDYYSEKSIKGKFEIFDGKWGKWKVLTPELAEKLSHGIPEKILDFDKYI